MPQCRCALSVAGALRHAAVSRLARTLGVLIHFLLSAKREHQMSDSETSALPPATPKQPDPANISHVTDWIKEPFAERSFRTAVAEHVSALAQKHGLVDYTLLYLLDAQDELSSWHSNRIYNAASAANPSRAGAKPRPTSNQSTCPDEMFLRIRPYSPCSSIIRKYAPFDQTGR